MIRDIIISIAVTLLMAALISSALYFAFDVSILKSSIVTILLQVLGFYIWNSYLQYKMKRVLIEEETKRLESYTAQGVEVNCAYCNSINYIPVRFDQDNGFECTDCGKHNSVYVDVKTAQKTDIIDIEQAKKRAVEKLEKNTNE